MSDKTFTATEIREALLLLVQTIERIQANPLAGSQAQAVRFATKDAISAIAAVAGALGISLEETRLKNVN